MVKTLCLVGLVAALTLANIGSAQARIFEPQANWWSAGRTCAANREPAGRRWRAMPPRSCARDARAVVQRDDAEDAIEVRVALLTFVRKSKTSTS